MRAPNITHIFFQSQKTTDGLLEHIASVFGLDLPQNRAFEKFDDDFLDKRSTSKRPTREKVSSPLLTTVCSRLARLEPQIKVITVPVRERVDSDYALRDWLREPGNGTSLPGLPPIGSLNTLLMTSHTIFTLPNTCTSPLPCFKLLFIVNYAYECPIILLTKVCIPAL
ncbi:hypothetical protein AN958_01601 [Leucoagaricus sp. SymC.cos]|nr:hypothetical protein AN958_01601 [Leucoagaricus sp. SymC.cos]